MVLSFFLSYNELPLFSAFIMFLMFFGLRSFRFSFVSFFFKIFLLDVLNRSSIALSSAKSCFKHAWLKK